MRTSVNIPKELLEEARKAAGVKTQTMAIILGLQEIIRRKRLDKLVALAGSGIVKSPSPREWDRLRRR